DGTCRRRPPVSVDGRTPRLMLSNRRRNGVRPMERMAFRAQTIVADVVLAAIAFALAFLISPVHGPGVGPVSSSTLSFVQLVVLYAGLAGGLTVLFRRELSPWRYVSIPDVMVPVRRALL